jgi:hypothetical protein
VIQGPASFAAGRVAQLALMAGFPLPPVRENLERELSLESGKSTNSRLATHWPTGCKWGVFSANDVRLNLTKERKNNEHGQG